MKIVIEIDDARFKDIRRIACVQLENYHFKTVEQIIANGIPLPKRHGRLIDADAFHKVVEEIPIKDTDKWFNWMQKTCNRLADAPTIIEADKE